ncbi:unnamed protein product [Amoebophrya sp. A25]|nr:unnamed protein product [Amoebophrya sp. A25]CAD7976908.1 unnamed protein product [Amoebophrya sp. A25]|eukprot:GSA25T00027043001.1
MRVLPLEPKVTHGADATRTQQYLVLREEIPISEGQRDVGLESIQGAKNWTSVEAMIERLVDMIYTMVRRWWKRLLQHWF